MTPRLKSEFWVSALIRRVQSMNGFATVLRKGDTDAGITLIIIRHGENLTYYAPERDFSGNRIWWPEVIPDQSSLDIRLNRRVDEDPDIWIVEIESDAAAEVLIGEPIEAPPSEPDPVEAAAQALFRGR